MDVFTSGVFTKIRKANTRVIVLEGSSRSTKTYSIIQFLVSQCMGKTPIKITITRARHTWLRDTAMLDFFDILKDIFKCYDDRRYNKAESNYTFPNGSTVAFTGLDEPQKLHGRKQDIAWINEAIGSTYQDLEQLLLRTSNIVILDYNPSADAHWIYDRVITRDDCTFIHSTYKDNPFLSPAIVEEIERLEPNERNIQNGTADEISWKIYGLGIRASQKGIIFPDWELCKAMPINPKKSFYGLDFGFTNDPTTLINIAYDNECLYYDEIFYKRGLVNLRNPQVSNQDSIEAQFVKNGIKKDSRIYADSAEPKSIRDLQNAGWHGVQPSMKGADSIVNGIDIMKRFKTYVTERSLNLWKEKQNYKWAVDKYGVATNKPISSWDHCIDSIRYGVTAEMGQSFRTEKYKATTPTDANVRYETVKSKIQYYEKRGEHERSFD